MATDNPPPRPPIRRRPPPRGTDATSPFGPYRFILRILGIPILAVAGVFIYNGVRDRLTLPDCDSDRAKKTLAQVLSQLKLEPTDYAPITTVSSSKTEIACNAVMPLPDGGHVAVDYSFYWQGGTAKMKYQVSRKPPGAS